MNKSYYNAESNLIAKRLRQLRKERGFSQEELAAQLQLLGVDINQPLISKIERNRRFVKDYELACIPIISITPVFVTLSLIHI